MTYVAEIKSKTESFGVVEADSPEQLAELVGPDLRRTIANGCAELDAGRRYLGPGWPVLVEVGLDRYLELRLPDRAAT